LHNNTLSFVLSCIECGDHEVLYMLNMFAKTFIVGSKFLTVFAPRGVELDKHIFIRVLHYLTPRLAHYN
jgi:hypothetical protein